MRLLQRLLHFDSIDSAQLQTYLDSLRQSWSDTSSAITRNSWIIVLLIASFELVSDHLVSSATLGPLVLANLKYLRIFIPTVVSYLYYEQVLLAVRWIESEAACRYIVHILSPEIEEYDLDSLLAPRLPSLSNMTHGYSPSSRTWSKSLRGVAQYILSALLLVSVPVFDAVALNELSSEFGSSSVLYWINVVITGGLITLTLAVAVLWLFEERLIF
jgi:hypothetical protein